MIWINQINVDVSKCRDRAVEVACRCREDDDRVQELLINIKYMISYVSSLPLGLLAHLTLAQTSIMMPHQLNQIKYFIHLYSNLTLS